MVVAIVLTVYGIETQLKICPDFGISVAIVLTVYGIETLLLHLLILLLTILLQ